MEQMPMDDFLLLIGRSAGIVGVIICAVAGATRGTGAYALGNFQAGTLLLVGMAAMIVGCLCFLTVLTNRERAKR
jgi:hypothetical protein